MDNKLKRHCFLVLFLSRFFIAFLHSESSLERVVECAFIPFMHFLGKENALAWPLVFSAVARLRENGPSSQSF